MTENTPEKVTDLIDEARKWASSSPLGKITAREVDRGILFARRLADALEAVSAEVRQEQERRSDLATEYQKAGRSWDTTRERLVDERNEARAERDEALARIPEHPKED